MFGAGKAMVAGERLAGWYPGVSLGALRLCCRVGRGSEQLWPAPGAAGGGKAPWLPGAAGRELGSPPCPCPCPARAAPLHPRSGGSAGRRELEPLRGVCHLPGLLVPHLCQQHSPRRVQEHPGVTGLLVAHLSQQHSPRRVRDHPGVTGHPSPAGAEGQRWAWQFWWGRSGGFIPSFPHEAARFAHPALVMDVCPASASCPTALLPPCCPALSLSRLCRLDQGLIPHSDPPSCAWALHQQHLHL